jgi:hypothetical protein
MTMQFELDVEVLHLKKIDASGAPSHEKLSEIRIAGSTLEVILL